MALILHKMYLDTKQVVFRKKVVELCGILAHTLVLDKEPDLPRYNYLEGYSGILETMVSILTGTHNFNEERLLII